MTDDNDAELYRQFPFGIDPNIARFTQVKNEGREAWHTNFTTYVSKQSKRRVWQQFMLLINVLIS